MPQWGIQIAAAGVQEQSTLPCAKAAPRQMEGEENKSLVVARCSWEGAPSFSSRTKGFF